LFIYAPLNASGIQALNTFIAIFKNYVIAALGNEALSTLPPDKVVTFEVGYDPVFADRFFRLEKFFELMAPATLKGVLDWLAKYQIPEGPLIRGAVEAYASFGNHNLLKMNGKDAIDFYVNVGGSRGLLGSLVDLVKAIKEFPGKVIDLYRAIDRILPLVVGAVPKLIDAFVDSPTKLFTNVIGGIADAFGKFFDGTNVAAILAKGTEWLLGNLKGAFDQITIPQPLTLSAIPGVVVDALTKLSNIDQINWTYFKEVLANVSGLDVDDLLRHIPDLGLAALENSTNLVKDLVGKFGEFSSGIVDEFKVRAQEMLQSALLNGAKTFFLETLAGGGGVILSKLISTFNWLTDPKTLATIEDLLKQFFQNIDTVLQGPVDNVGTFLKDLMNKAVPILLGFAASQLSIANLPNQVLNMVKAIDLKAWMYMGVENFWKTIKSRVPGNVKGAPITDAFFVGDPWSIQGVAKKDANGVFRPLITIDTEPLVERLQSWLPLRPDLAADIQNMISKVKAVQGDPDRAVLPSAPFREVLGVLGEMAGATKAGQSTTELSKKLKAKKALATAHAKTQLQGSLNELLAKISPVPREGSAPKYFGFDNVSVPWQKEQVPIATGLKVLITPKSIRAENQRESFRTGPTEPEWWGRFETGEPAPPGTEWERGHLFGSKLGGAGVREWANMVPLVDQVNRGIMLNYERIVAKAVLGSTGKLPMNIDFHVTPTYFPGKLAPASVRILAMSAGDRGASFLMDVTILNKLGPQPQSAARVGW